MSNAPDAGVRAFIEDHRRSFLADLVDWLRIPSVSVDPAHDGDVRRSAEWLAETLRATGFPTVEVWSSAGGPAVFAQWPADEEGSPTVLVYGHHDVQPAARAEGWDSDPFEPCERDGRLYARGAADDKGQVLMHALGLRAHLAATGRGAPAVNLKFLIEGEEEAGSPNFASLIRTHADRLGCDVVLVADTGMWARDTPTIAIGRRGIVECQIDLYGPDRDVHSGTFGGAVPNPATEAARLAAALHDDDRKVAIPGFYDDVLPLTQRERDLIGELPFDEPTWLRTAASHAALGEAGYTTLERVWARPTAEVNGIHGGYAGPGGMTIVPSSARIKLSFRLVAGQTPENVRRLVTDWVDTRLPPGIRHDTTFWGDGCRPSLTPIDHPALRCLVAAMGRAFGQEIRFTRQGGSGPDSDLYDLLNVPMLFFGISIPSDGLHSTNEKVELDLLVKGAETAAYLWENLAQDWRSHAWPPGTGTTPLTA